MVKPVRFDGPTRASHSFMCLELAVGTRTGEPSLTVVVSLPGRESTVAHSWGTFGRLLTPAEWDDVRALCNKLMAEGYFLRHGLEEVLPLSP